MKFLHFSDNEEYMDDAGINNPLKKLENITKLLIENFQACCVPERDVSIDESLLLFKGRLGWKQYIPSKRARFGIKFFVLCESSTGYVVNFMIYTGKMTKYLPQYQNYGTGIKSVLTLMNGFLNKGYCIVVDNFYNSPELAEILISPKTDVYGTIKTNRKDVPEEIKNKKLKKGEEIAFQKGKMMIMKWQDKRTVAVLSTVYSTVMNSFIKNGNISNKPQAILDYNHTIGGVDRMDASLANYSIKRKQKYYYKKVFRQLLDISVWNAFILYKKMGGGLSNLNFRLKLIERIAEENIKRKNDISSTQRVCSAIRFEGNHFPSYIPPSEKKLQPTRRCYICCRKENENGKKTRRETRYFCKKCDVALCPAPCFEAYHTKPNL